MTTENYILFNNINDIGIITFNRERKLNALNPSMVHKILSTLNQCDSLNGIIIKGKGHFSAGGDVKNILQNADKKTLMPRHVTYNILYKISNLESPSIAIVNGIAMGAGLALAMFTRYRVATEETVVAMPEVKIGLIPDVGASYFLPRLKYRMGYYMALTGASLKGKDILRAGIATHFVQKIKLNDLEKSLLTCKTDEDFRRVLNEFSESDAELPLAANIKDIEYCFGGNTVEDIVKRLEAVQNDWSAKTITALKTACPGSVKIANKSLRLGSQLDSWRCLQMDYRLIYWSVKNHDFREGVRAVFVDKDHKPKWNPKSLSDVTEEYIESFFRGVRAMLVEKDRKPKWNPKSLSDVTEEYIESFFRPLPADLELFFYANNNG